MAVVVGGEEAAFPAELTWQNSYSMHLVKAARYQLLFLLLGINQTKLQNNATQ